MPTPIGNDERTHESAADDEGKQGRTGRQHDFVSEANCIAGVFDVDGLAGQHSLGERPVSREFGCRGIDVEQGPARGGEQDELVLLLEPHRGDALLVRRADGVERGAKAGGYLLDRGRGREFGGNGLQAGEVVRIALGTNPSRTLGLEGVHPFQGDGKSFGHQLEQLDVELVEVGQLPAAHVEHTEDALFEENRDRGDRSQATVAQHGRDDIDRRQVVDQKGLPGGHDLARHALTASNPEAKGDLLAQSVRCPGHELVPSFVGD